MKKISLHTDTSELHRLPVHSSVVRIVTRLFLRFDICVTRTSGYSENTDMYRICSQCLNLLTTDSTCSQWLEQRELTKDSPPPGLFSLAVARSPLLNRRGFYNEDRDSATRLCLRARCGVNGREPRHNRVTSTICQLSNNDKVAAMFIENWKWSAQHLATAAAAMSPSGRENDQRWFLVHDSWTNNTGLAFVRTGQLGNYESGEFLFNWINLFCSKHKWNPHCYGKILCLESRLNIVESRLMEVVNTTVFGFKGLYPLHNHSIIIIRWHNC